MRLLPAIAALFLVTAGGSAMAQAPARPAMHPVRMGLTSTSFADGGVIPDRYTMKGGAAAGSPQLAWTGAPAGTQSFTLVMHDLDVVIGSSTEDNLHWLAFNIPATTTTLPEGVPGKATLPDGMVQPYNRTHYGYTPPGAPPGVYHHYVFEIYALDTKLALGPTASRADVMKAMEGHVLDRATLVGRFHR